MKLAFKPKLTAAPPVLKKSAAFASLDDDEPLDAAPTLSTHQGVAANKQLIAKNVGVSKTMQQRMAAEMQVDATVYEYDEVWDAMQLSKQRQKDAKEADAKERKPKHIGNLLSSAAQRKRDRLLAEEKMMQREREAEGDEFKDKESFVTQAYKDQMAQAHREAEEEERREEQRKKEGGSSSGMAHFYRQLLDDTERTHEATVAATQKRTIGPEAPALNLTVTKPPDFTPVSDLELAQRARDAGKEVELNDDNQIVDKRDLLSAGLNLSGVNTRRLGAGLNGSGRKTEEQVQTHRAVGTAASRREIQERRAREIKQQMTAEEHRQLEEKREAEAEAIRRVVVKRNNDDDVQSAKERYLARKRQKLEQQQQEGDGE